MGLEGGRSGAHSPVQLQPCCPGGIHQPASQLGGPPGACRRQTRKRSGSAALCNRADQLLGIAEPSGQLLRSWVTTLAAICLCCGKAARLPRAGRQLLRCCHAPLVHSPLCFSHCTIQPQGQRRLATPPDYRQLAAFGGLAQLLLRLLLPLPQLLAAGALQGRADLQCLSLAHSCLVLLERTAVGRCAQLLSSRRLPLLQPGSRRLCLRSQPKLGSAAAHCLHLGCAALGCDLLQGGGHPMPPQLQASLSPCRSRMQSQLPRPLQAGAEGISIKCFSIQRRLQRLCGSPVASCNLLLGALQHGLADAQGSGSSSSLAVQRNWSTCAS